MLENEVFYISIMLENNFFKIVYLFFLKRIIG